MRIDHYLDRHNEFKFATILDEPLEGEEEMIKAWRTYTYGIIYISLFNICIYIYIHFVCEYRL